MKRGAIRNACCYDRKLSDIKEYCALLFYKHFPTLCQICTSISFKVFMSLVVTRYVHFFIYYLHSFWRIDEKLQFLNKYTFLKVWRKINTTYRYFLFLTIIHTSVCESHVHCILKYKNSLLCFSNFSFLSPFLISCIRKLILRIILISLHRHAYVYTCLRGGEFYYYFTVRVLSFYLRPSSPSFATFLAVWPSFIIAYELQLSSIWIVKWAGARSACKRQKN